MRIALGIEYDGSRYRGWQKQRHASSVQEQVEVALSRVANEPVEVFCAGRTDAGVHGTGQVVHFDTRARRTDRAWVLGSNSNLPRDITVLWAREVSEDFHARFSALSRSYRYVILNRLTRPAIANGKVAWWHLPLEVEPMQAAARHLLGTHDFTSFRASECQARGPVRTIEHLKLWREGDLIYLDIRANAFLHHMVRNIAGTLMAVGEGEQAPDWVADVLLARDRKAAGITAPAAGLYLVHVGYPEEFGAFPPPRLPVFF